MFLNRRHLSPVAAEERDEAVSGLYREHWAGMVRLALLMLGDRPSAEDVVQDAYAGLYRRWDRIVDHTKAVSYLRSSVLNGSRTVLRRRTAARRLVHSEPPVWSTESEAMLSEERREVLAALHTLPTRQREVLVLRFYLRLSDPEIASTLGIREVSVRSAASRGLAALARKLEDNR
ncbi:RNA polymerase sigma-70 factor (sigma-E family) [Kribbella antiqua]|uniref:RNA polymerase sigma-70 factor (Sigma-E family) n=1 Tax=Kribbella antiqua TaxID=2512217 RepID=A0A4R2J2J9_9ACTN|nr:RNA polymerase sigma-70 factor (sigma-E family) [Kribbella antiqua]